MADVTVEICELGSLSNYNFVVIFAGYNGKWIFCRHEKRSTYEIPGGHIENSESNLDAARRELWEETGAVDFEISPMFDYSVIRSGLVSNGQVFYAEVYSLGELPKSEICEILLSSTLPENLTYPLIQPILFNKLISELSR